MSKFLKISTGLSRAAAVQGTDIGSGAATSTQFLAANGSTASAFRAIALTDFPSIASDTILGNNSGGSAVPTALTVAQVNAILPIFTSLLNGLAPASGGGTTNFLRADGTWAAAGGSSPLTTKGDIYTYTTTNARQPVPGDYGRLIPDSTQSTGWRSAPYNEIQQGGPGKQYIQYADFENNSTTGWTLGTIGTLTNGLPTGSPTFGSGASGNLSISAVSSGAIEGTYSLSYASSAATTQGNMVATSSYAIDLEDQAKVLTVKFYYMVSSGVANCNFSGTSSNSFAWAIYDVTNSSWLSSAGNFNLVQNSGCGYVTGTCQTNSTTANIRLVVYNANATSGAATLILDGFYVGPQTAPSGPAMTDWNNNLTFTPNSGFGSTTGNNIWYERDGNDIHVRGYWTNGTVTSTNVSLSLPVSMDVTKMGSSTVNLGIWNTGSSSAASIFSSAGNSGIIFFDGSTTGSVFFASQTSGGTFAKVGGTSIANSSEPFYVDFRVPVAGWSSNTSMSSDTDTRVVAAAIAAGANTTVTSGSVVVLASPVVLFDTHAAYNTSTGVYTVPVSGIYDVEVSGLNYNSTPPILYLNKNSAYYTRLAIATGTGTGGGSTMIQCNAGDTLDLYSAQSDTLGFQSGSGNISGNRAIFTFKRLSGPAVVTATESVNGRYFSSTTSISGSLATIAYATKGWDTHGAYNSSTGIWTAPVSGKYQFNVSADIAGTFVLNSTVDMQVQQTGSSSQISENNQYAFASATDIAVMVTDQFYCLANDTIKVQISSSASGPSIVSSNSKNYFSWSRVGN